jgi:hypothetical protein
LLISVRRAILRAAFLADVVFAISVPWRGARRASLNLREKLRRRTASPPLPAL